MSFIPNLNPRIVACWFSFLFLIAPFQADVHAQFGEPALTATSWYELKEGTRKGNLYVQAFVQEGYHCYSQYHPGVETKSRMEIPESDDFTILGKFEPDQPPHIEFKDGVDYELSLIHM